MKLNLTLECRVSGLIGPTARGVLYKCKHEKSVFLMRIYEGGLRSSPPELAHVRVGTRVSLGCAQAPGPEGKKLL